MGLEGEDHVSQNFQKNTTKITKILENGKIQFAFIWILPNVLTKWIR
jgi:hypothetical protein